MNIEVFNKDFQRIAICDNYESFIWTDRYNDCGDFELYFGMDIALLEIYQPDYYLMFDQSEHVMIIEDLQVTTDTETGNHLVVRGRSLESILKRRIVWTQTVLKGNFQNAIKKLTDNNIEKPTNTKRKVSNFKFIVNNDDRIKNISLEDDPQSSDDVVQFTGDVLFDAIKGLCDIFNVGFKITLNANNEFEFRLYVGEDRSYSQSALPYVVFSPTFENIINSDYSETKSGYCNVTLVAGEGEGKDRKTQVAGEVDSQGLDRRELYTDARDISSEVQEEGQQAKTIPIAQYNKMLKNRGKENLAEFGIKKEFNGEVEATQLYKYGEDFFMGDVTTLENEYGLVTRVQVMEFIYSDSTSETTAYPTFKVVDNEEENSNV